MKPGRALLPALRAGWIVARVLGAAGAALAPVAGHACGVCVEDNVAATYDHQVLTRAKAAGAVVVFCQVSAQFDAAQLVKSARRVAGVSGQSVRTSNRPPALSFAFDPARQTPQAAVDAIGRSLPAGTRVSIVRVMK
jgi:hypothetical protein